MKLPRTRAALLTVLLACSAPRVDVSSDRRAYNISPADSLAMVRLTVRNQGSRSIYLQTVDGRVDLGVLIRVDADGRVLVGADTASREIWSLFAYRKSNLPPQMGVLPLGPNSVVTNTYPLPRGYYRILVKFGAAPETLDEHGVWVENFSIQ